MVDLHFDKELILLNTLPLLGVPLCLGSQSCEPGASPEVPLRLETALKLRGSFLHDKDYRATVQPLVARALQSPTRAHSFPRHAET